ncbi:hypothetical protein MPTK1_3g16770 [Marchantia polymorpha subsp. ruderalis]|uniref:Uncharacterized protein n=2 Tax=Marchantia polymorpha TaxID=3197 RepID=A0AAF6B1K9_MARPO|nr:hypothetical protein MARPO_0039s0118 [Marchantia polymorpha]BBN05893.1 hypothetical protein Mp_3g16770 [Marchantia polymorpha subsp. ruderalis]|eukprot:PTQ40632.1 hypothetical protein MARPO_0039s0118 [Marchantia polymorpha]
METTAGSTMGRRHVHADTLTHTNSMGENGTSRFRQDSGCTKRFGRISRTLTWDFEADEQLEVRLLEELELEKSVVVTGANGPGGSHRDDDNNRISALGRVLQQRPFPRVNTLCLADCSLAEESGAMAELAKAIGAGNLSNLDWLNLLDNSFIGDLGAKALAEALKSGHLNVLRRLDLVDNGIGDAGLTALAGALGSGQLKALKKLRLGGDYELFLTSGAKALAEVFASGHLPRLTDLHLRGFGEEEGVLAILKALESSSIRRAFKKLELRHCHLGLEAAKTLASALQSRPFGSLTRLDLKDNILLRDEELTALSAAFRSKNLNDLWYLDFSGTSVGEKGLIELASLLEAGHLPGLDQCYASGCVNTKLSALALVRAYDRNASLVANIDIDWPRTSRADKRIYWPSIKFFEVNGAWCTFGRSKVLWPKHTWQKYAEYFKARNRNQMSSVELQKRNMNTF